MFDGHRFEKLGDGDAPAGNFSPTREKEPPYETVGALSNSTTAHQLRFDELERPRQNWSDPGRRGDQPGSRFGLRTKQCSYVGRTKSIASEACATGPAALHRNLSDRSVNFPMASVPLGPLHCPSASALAPRMGTRSVTSALRLRLFLCRSFVAHLRSATRSHRR